MLEVVACHLNCLLRQQEIVITSPHSIGEHARNVLHIEVDCFGSKFAAFYSQPSFPGRFDKLLNLW